MSLEQDEQFNQVPDNPVVSVFMLAYNHEKYIRQAIEGVMVQKTNFPFELCIGEDDSPDETRAICREYAKQHPDKIRLFLRSRENVIFIDGRPTGRYNSIMTRKACRGKYISICEGDDFWIDENKLQLQFDFLESHPDYSICSTLGIERTAGRQQPDVIKPTFGAGTLEHGWFLSGKTGMLTVTLFYRADCVRDQLLYDVKIPTGDWALLLGATENGRKCVVLPSITGVYRNHGSGFWSGIDDVRRAKTRILTLERYLACAPEEDQAVIRKRIKMMRQSIAYATCRNEGGSQWSFFFKCLASSTGREYVVERVVNRFWKSLGR